MQKDRRLAYEGILFTIFIGLVLLWAVRTAASWDELRASIIVFLLGGIGVALAVVQVVRDLQSNRGASTSEPRGISFDAPAVQSTSRWGNFEIWGWLVAFYAAIRLIGFLAAVPLFVFTYAKVYGARWFLAITLAAAAWAFIYGTFEHILHVPWPESVLSWLVAGD